jgi:hypothetical protein
MQDELGETLVVAEWLDVLLFKPNFLKLSSCQWSSTLMHHHCMHGCGAMPLTTHCAMMRCAGCTWTAGSCRTHGMLGIQNYALNARPAGTHLTSARPTATLINSQLEPKRHLWFRGNLQTCERRCLFLFFTTCKKGCFQYFPQSSKSNDGGRLAGGRWATCDPRHHRRELDAAFCSATRPSAEQVRLMLMHCVIAMRECVTQHRQTHSPPHTNFASAWWSVCWPLATHRHRITHG